MSTLSLDDVWHLEAESGCVQDAIRAWGGIRDATGNAGADASDLVTQVSQAWEGARADSYLAYAPTLVRALEMVHGMSQAVITQLHALHDLTASTQRDLDASFARVGALALSVRRREGQVHLELPDDDVAEEVRREHARAREVQEDARLEVGSRTHALEAVAADAEALAAEWAAPASGEARWDVPRVPGLEPVLPDGSLVTRADDTGVTGPDGGPTHLRDGR